MEPSRLDDFLVPNQTMLIVSPIRFIVHCNFGRRGGSTFHVWVAAVLKPAVPRYLLHELCQELPQFHGLPDLSGTPDGLLHVSSIISWGCWRIHIPLVKYSNSMCLTCLYELASIGINPLVGQKVGWHYGFPLFPVM